MKIRRLAPSDVDLVASWLAAEANHKWLDFGQGVQALSAISLRMMAQRDLHLLHVFSADSSVPAGIVALSNIDRKFGTATLWYVLGDKKREGQGLTTEAVVRILDVAFRELGLKSVNAWAVERNRASVRVLEKSGFRPVGRLRSCHTVDGVTCDRILFDILASEVAAPPARPKGAGRKAPGKRGAARRR